MSLVLFFSSLPLLHSCEVTVCVNMVEEIFSFFLPDPLLFYPFLLVHQLDTQSTHAAHPVAGGLIASFLWLHMCVGHVVAFPANSTHKLSEVGRQQLCIPTAQGGETLVRVCLPECCAWTMPVSCVLPTVIAHTSHSAERYNSVSSSPLES